MGPYEIGAAVVGGIASILVIRTGIQQRKQILKEEFKASIRSDFQKNYAEAWAKYVPTPKDVMTYQQFLENQQAQANMSSMMMNGAFAAGGTSIIADLARLNSALTASSIKKKAMALYRILFCCQKIVEAINSPSSETEEVIEYSAELAFQTKEAMKIGALPYDIHSMNTMTIPYGLDPNSRGE